MGADIGLLSEPNNERSWRISCKRCGGSVGIVRLKLGSMEGWLMQRLVCPSGSHQISVPGEGLTVERFYESGANHKPRAEGPQEEKR
jgi:hypothetical protein